jgi:hypothetical protein
MKKILLATLLSLSAMTANATDKEIKIEVPTDVPELMFTEAHKTDLTQYCTNAFAVGSAGVFVPALNIMKMAIVYPDAPLANKYFSKEDIRIAQEAYLKMADEKNTKKRLSTAALWGIKIIDEKLGKDNDKLFAFLKNIYNDVARACNQKYTGGHDEMFLIIK